MFQHHAGQLAPPERDQYALTGLGIYAAVEIIEQGVERHIECHAQNTHEGVIAKASAAVIAMQPLPETVKIPFFIKSPP